MKIYFVKSIKFAAIVAAAVAMSACVVAPQQPIGYRMTNTMLPTYVNGQYIGMQPSGYTVPPAQVAATNSAPTTSVAAAAPAPVTNEQPTVVQQQTPVYIQSPAPSVVYVQTPTPVYTYDPYYYSGYYPGYYSGYYPGYINPWYRPSIGIGVGFGYRGGWRHR